MHDGKQSGLSDTMKDRRSPDQRMNISSQLTPNDPIALKAALEQAKEDNL